MKYLITVIFLIFLCQSHFIKAGDDDKTVKEKKEESSEGISPEIQELITRIKKLTESQAFKEMGRTITKGNKLRLKVILHVYPAFLNKQDKFGCTPLYNAVFAQQKELVKYLLNKRAKVSIVNVDGDTPLHRAAAEGIKEIIEVLIQKGAFYYTKNKKGRTPLFSAALQGEVEAAEILLEKGDRVNRQDKLGDTPLHLAALKGKEKMVKFLLQNGADSSIKNKKDKTPADLAKNDEVTKLLNKQ